MTLDGGSEEKFGLIDDLYQLIRPLLVKRGHPSVRRGLRGSGDGWSWVQGVVIVIYRLHNGEWRMDVPCYRIGSG